MKHLKENNETYINHFLFAGKVGIILTFRGIIFMMHAAFPVCNVPKKWNLENTLEKVHKWNAYTNERIQK
tara:strand:- start:27 stop:236 length:210 start_codon:yes stop_codon:yes gene_type:complete